MKARLDLLPLLWLAVACASAPEPSANAPAKPAGAVVCPKDAPAMGNACQLAPPGADAKGGELGFCAYRMPTGAERVCHCEDQHWKCYDKPPAEPPGLMTIAAVGD
jgi:hypothetical protein